MTAYAAERPAGAVSTSTPDCGRQRSWAGCARTKRRSSDRRRQAFAALLKVISGDRLAPDTRAEIDAHTAAARRRCHRRVLWPGVRGSDDELADYAVLLERLTAPYLLVLGDQPPAGYLDWVQVKVPSRDTVGRLTAPSGARAPRTPVSRQRERDRNAGPGDPRQVITPTQ